MLRSRPSSAPPALAALLMACSLAAACGGSLERGGQPNVLFVLVDDLGYGDLGSYGSPDALTPRLDQLAEQGVRCTDFYVTSPVCSSSRASILTGRYPERHRLVKALTAEDAGEGLMLRETLLPELLGNCGYSSALVGKWHLGDRPAYRPLRRGFDEFFGMLRAANSYDSYTYRGIPDLWDGAEPVDREGIYSTELFTDEAIAFLERHAGGTEPSPWFLFLSYNAPHLADDRKSIPAPDKWRALFEDADLPQTRRDFLAAVAALDDGIGRVLDALDRLDLADDTLVVFLSDNGPLPTHGSAGGLRGGKDDIDEGGIRVPCLARWPGRLPAGAVCREPLLSMDWMATILADACSEQAGVHLDGRDILPTLAGLQSSPHEALFWSHYGRKRHWDGVSARPRRRLDHGVRRGRWRLTVQGTEASRLYDLESDPGQERNVAGDHPDIVDELLALLDERDAVLPYPIADAR